MFIKIEEKTNKNAQEIGESTEFIYTRYTNTIFLMRNFPMHKDRRDQKKIEKKQK